MEQVLLVVGTDPAVVDFVAYSKRRGERTIRRLNQHLPTSGCPTHVVVFLEDDLAKANKTLARFTALAEGSRAQCICLVSSVRAYLGDTNFQRAEAFYLSRLKPMSDRVAVFRPGHVLSENSQLRSWLHWLGPLVALIPQNLTSCFVEGEELFAAIEGELERPAARALRTFALFGQNRPWRDLVAPPSTAIGRAFLAIVRVLLGVLLLGPLVAWLLRIFSKRVPALAGMNVNTLRPGSIQELLTLYNPYNYRHVKIVGYNNGVVHFGHQYPGRTLVSTIRCDKLARVRGDSAQFDCGVTIRRAMDVLAAEGKELYVLPNYSYVSLGTSFFVPIHGSASKFCTVGETIESAILYDPVEDRVIAASSLDAEFGRYLYNLSAEVLLLRLGIRVKEKSRYYVKQETVVNPTARAVWDWFHDRAASNVEVRKAGSATPKVTVYRYYTEMSDGPSGSLELPRDRLGRLWDRLEENPVTSLLFHGLSRRLAHHVELFLSEDEFRAFWETHASQPIAKIQLRFIRRDGFPHSPFRDHDCISADLFMLKKHRPAFEAYLKQTLPAVKMNPGKHSR